LRTQLFIDGTWQDSESQQTYSRVNPANPDEVLGQFQKGNTEDAKRAIDAAEDSHRRWADTPPPKRADYVLRVCELLREQKEDFAVTITREMGKVLDDARQEVQQTIDLAYYIAGEGRRLLGHTTTSEREDKFAFTLRMPIGVIGLITPWNFPLLILARKILYSLVCGNTVVLKPSSEAPMCACRLVEVLRLVGIPKGTVNLVTGSGEVVGNTIVTHKHVRLVSFCGHKDTGAEILRAAGPKRVSLELGGKNPLIIMDDADLGLATHGVVWSGYATAGQRCTAASRVIIHEKIKPKFEAMVAEQIRKLRLGNGFDPETDIGPLVNKKAQLKMVEYCQIALNEGAKLVIGGKIPSDLKGWYFEPTLLSECCSDMQVCRDEIFGPIVSVLSAKNLDEAIDIANCVDYGLSSSIYTTNINNAFTAIKRLQAGLTYLNHPTVGSEPHMPFGGIKYSGNNRESGPEGVNEFTELKTVVIDYNTGQPGSSKLSYGPP
jgi:alpha-ketoglutaric semialdehyde dehydrogenase